MDENELDETDATVDAERAAVIATLRAIAERLAELPQERAGLRGAVVCAVEQVAPSPESCAKNYGSSRSQTAARPVLLGAGRVGDEQRPLGHAGELAVVGDVHANDGGALAHGDDRRLGGERPASNRPQQS